VVGVRCRLKGLKVTGRAGRSQARVLIVYVTGGTGDCRVFSGERESGGAVIEGGACPLCRGVTERTVAREARGNVIGISSALIGVQMARVTGLGQSGIDAAYVALSTARCRMFAGQGEGRLRTVIKGSWRPTGRRVAENAGLREARRRVVRI
jgi:hypothetical protein